LEGAAVFLLPTIRVVGATAETGFVGAWATGAIHALLRVGTRRIEACQQAFSVDADLRIPALEVELAAKGRWLRVVFERIETQPVVGTGRAYGTIVHICAFGHAADAGADLAHGAVGGRKAQTALGSGLGVAPLSLAQETALLVDRPVAHADIP
jgi:hypothetical protein